MRRKVRLTAIMAVLVIVALGFWWSWAQFSEDAVSDANYQLIKDGMTLGEVRAILGTESRTDIWVGDAIYWRWEGRNKVISVRIPQDESTVQGKDIADENSMIRQMKLVADQMSELYSRLTSSNSSATPVTMTVP